MSLPALPLPRSTARPLAVLEDITANTTSGYLTFAADTHDGWAFVKFDLAGEILSEGGDALEVNDRLAPVLTTSATWSDAHILRLALAGLWGPGAGHSGAGLDVALEVAVPNPRGGYGVKKSIIGQALACGSAALTCTAAVTWFPPAGGACVGLDRPQRLGFLPTFWFWNNRERQRLLLPLIVTIALPLTPLLFFLMVRSQLPMWTLIVAGTVWPQLVCGLVERRIRGQLRRRALDAGPHVPAPLPSEPRRSSDRVFVLLAGFGALGSSLAVAAAWGPGPALLTALALALVLAGAWAVSPRLSQLEAGAQAGPALTESSQSSTQPGAHR